MNLSMTVSSFFGLLLFVFFVFTCFYFVRCYVSCLLRYLSFGSIVFVGLWVASVQSKIFILKYAVFLCSNWLYSGLYVVRVFSARCKTVVL